MTCMHTDKKYLNGFTVLRGAETREQARCEQRQESIPKSCLRRAFDETVRKLDRRARNPRIRRRVRPNRVRQRRKRLLHNGSVHSLCMGRRNRLQDVAHDGDEDRVLVVLHPDIEDRDDNRAREVIGDPLALVDLHDGGEGLEDERECIFGRDWEERTDVLGDPRRERHCDSIVDILAEARICQLSAL